MALYIISYDLLKRPTMDDYKELISELRRLGAKPVLLSQWAWKSTDSSTVIRDHLRRFMDADDRILVTEISTTNWAGWNLITDMNKL